MPHCSKQKEAFAIMGTLGQAPLREMTSTSLPLCLPLCRGYLQCRRMIIEWVPSHIIIRGKELADRLAENGKGVPPSPMYLKKILRYRSIATGQVTLLQLHREESSPRPDGQKAPRCPCHSLKQLRDNGHTS